MKDIEPVTELTDQIVSDVSPPGFWQSKSFDELALEQGIHPIDNWALISNQWPEDTDFESFLKAVRHSRRGTGD